MVEFEGESFLGRVVNGLRHGGVTSVTVVIARGMEDVSEASRAVGARVAVNPDPDRGQLSSLQTGVESLRGGCSGAIVALVDHPFVRPGTYRAVVQALEDQEGALVVPTFRGRRGHPLGMGRRWFPELWRVPNGEGARWLLHRYAHRVVELPTSDPGILLDIDTGDDLDRAVHRMPGAGGPEGAA